MSVTVIQTQRVMRLPVRLVRDAAQFFALASQRRIGDVAWQSVTVHLIDDDASATVNRAILGHQGPTDVITQRYDAIPGEPEGLTGELFVNVAQAMRAAPRRRGWSTEREVLLYVAHGMDHLSGADDHAPADYARMRRRELMWLRRWYASRAVDDGVNE